MSDRIKVTPERLREQSARLLSLNKQMDDIYSKANRALTLMDDALEGKFTSNMHIKARNLLTSVRTLSTSLYEGSQVADRAASAYVDADSILTKLNQEDTQVTRALEKHTKQAEKNIAEMKEASKPVDVSNYCNNVTDAEYARLCKLSYDALKKSDPQKAFIDLLHNDSYLPDNDPLKNISSKQVVVTESVTGFSAITIFDGDTAIVIFAGTNGDVGDLVADGQLTLGKSSAQSAQAILMIEALSKQYSNIVVTGHSLGGYLATAATLKNDNITKCVAFDPPGRWDTANQNIFNGDRASKVTTYEAKGSAISKVGFGVGDVHDIKVEENGSFLGHNHGIKQICDALGGKQTIKNSWS